MRDIITRLLVNSSGISAVEDGIALGVFGTMIALGAPAIGSSFGGLLHAIGKFLGLI